jgi:hypothetical protein
MGTKARRIEHFPRMKVRGNNGWWRELMKACDEFQESCYRLTLTRPTLVLDPIDERSFDRTYRLDLDEIRPDWRDTRNGRLIATEQTGASA